MLQVLVVGKVKQQGLAVFRARQDFSLTVVEENDPTALADAIAVADGILVRTAPFTASMIEQAPRLKVVSRHGVGYDNVDLPALNARNIPLAIAANSNRIAVAEHAIFMMLELAKHGRAYDHATRNGNWAIRNSFAAFELFEKVLLVVGFGRIGREVVSRAKAFGMRILIVDPFVAKHEIEAAGGIAVSDLRTALPQADFVTLHLPLGDQTRNLLAAEAFALMKSSGILINTARGGIVNEADLASALDAGRIRAAGLDVFEQEPPALDHPLFDREDVLLSPHSAGVTAESTVRMAVEAAENIVNVLDGKLDPQVIVNLEVLEPIS